MKLWIEFLAVLVMLGGVTGTFYLIIKQKAAIGIKTIQFLAIVLILPMLLVLGLEGILGRETLGVLFGTILGFILSGIGKE